MTEYQNNRSRTWGSEWERKRTNILADAQAELDRSQQEARAYAEAILLSSIADGLKKAGEIDPKLPHYVISMRFLSALQDLIHQQAAGEASDPENTKKMAEAQTRLRDWQNRISPNLDKERSS